MFYSETKVHDVLTFHIKYMVEMVEAASRCRRVMYHQLRSNTIPLPLSILCPPQCPPNCDTSLMHYTHQRYILSLTTFKSIVNPLLVKTYSKIHLPHNTKYRSSYIRYLIHLAFIFLFLYYLDLDKHK